jgi:hypothetical protein
MELLALEAKEEAHHAESEMVEYATRTNQRKSLMDWDYFKYTDGHWCRLSASAANSVRKPCYVEAGTVGKSWAQYTPTDKAKYLKCLSKASSMTAEANASCPKYRYKDACKTCTVKRTNERKSLMDWDYFKYSDGSWCRLSAKSANSVRRPCYAVAGTVGKSWNHYTTSDKAKYLKCLS